MCKPPLLKVSPINTISTTYDNDGLLTSSGAFTITRDADNGYTTKVADGTLTQTREYSNYGEITRVTDNSFAYNLTQRDNTGTITQKIETLGGIDTTYDYSYDSRGRLTSVSKNSQIVEEYTYDNNGNRLSATVDGVTISAYYTPDDNLEVYGDNTYRYDADGNLIEKTTPQGITTYSYTTKGTLKEVITPTETIEYVLNPLEQRVAKKVNGAITEKYLWADLTTLLAVYDADDNLVQRFNYTDSRMPISMTMDNQTYYLHYDQVGTLRAVSDTNHNIIKEITYDTFGNILSDTNQNVNIPFGFAGGLQDPHTNLVHFGYREYDPLAAKWTTKDPIDFNGGDTNLYGYVLNDPVNLVDSEGLKFSDIVKQGGKRAYQAGGAGLAGCTIIGTPLAGVGCAAVGVTFGFCGGVMEGLVYESAGLYDLKHKTINNVKNSFAESFKNGNKVPATPYPHVQLPNAGPVMLP